ncbi:phosphoglycerate mutase-like protein [Aspergillus campestris IBT 28561]|uniref:Phosphoglycerate mutase-like protein n=1 Tax=Aspergillus campestris (strain IBT 28561) TaxID=1392248 RepID=A0A2I1D8A1_ASPC2|nr:phosphoglycerate mutase-like protein [Aspergillus campestris IBT 28561]PKY06112.1 phosphoglycerate mutase-like protein [Aspergillus campestris IBT 28561]
MVTFLSLLLTPLFTPSSHAAQESPHSISFYPVALNHTTYITNRTQGTHGGIYSAPVHRASDPDENDRYNYCTMPHPRPETYVAPEPVANGSVAATLVYVEYMQRHQRRTPYNLLSELQDQEYTCDDVHPHIYAAPAPDNNNPAPIPVYGQTYTDPTNPFLTDTIPGTCQYPQLTKGGILDGYRHGRDLRAVYGGNSLLSETGPSSQVWLRASSSALTQGSAGAVLRGLWPDYNGGIALRRQTEGIDTVDSGFTCAARERMLEQMKAARVWREHLGVTMVLREELGEMFDISEEEEDGAWMNSFDHFADAFQARVCNGYGLPCRAKKEGEKEGENCVTQEQAEEVFRAGDWEWNYWFRGSDLAKEYIQLVGGLFIGEIVRRLEGVVEGRPDWVYSHTFMHDGDLGPVLGALGIRALRWPGMGANVAVEVWRTDGEGFYARVLYSGRTVETIHGTMEWMPLGELLEILGGFVPGDIVSMCED